jgi:hypothetical protein
MAEIRDFQEFACGVGHFIVAYKDDGEMVDLEGHFCPLCMGKVVGYGDTIDPRILAPVQTKSRQG